MVMKQLLTHVSKVCCLDNQSVKGSVGAEWGGFRLLWFRASTDLLATAKTASVAALAFSFSPKLTTGLNAKGFSREVNLLNDTTNESIT